MILLWYLLAVIRFVNANTETLLVYADPAYEIYNHDDSMNYQARTTIPCFLNLTQIYDGDRLRNVENDTPMRWWHNPWNPPPIELHNSLTLLPIKTIHRLNVEKGSTYFVSLCWSAIFPLDFSLNFAVKEKETPTDKAIGTKLQNVTVNTPIKELQDVSPGMYLIVEATPNYFALKGSNFKQYIDEIQYQINIEQCILVPGVTKRTLRLAGKITILAVIALLIAAKMSLWLKNLS
ncbi:BA75_00648T0 [Komagataella pastoris]|uniref:BA75_00648T0 n=1 Tax=Komagataella pastoris TaxID=4922 RepID=A0A1B2J8W7_PICPA|nr:BA75_00648T0 [Komagataella pastoris]